MNSQDKKVAIVTGGASGIGAEIALLFLAQNYRVVIADVHSPKKNQSKDPRLLFTKTDVSKEASVKGMVAKTLASFGRIDVLVNDAGLLPDDLPKTEKMTLATWNKFINTNLTGCFLCAKHAIAALRKSKGSIINIASTRALQAEGNDSPYAASKGGVVAFTRSLAMEVGPVIRVNSISPGWIDTGNLPVKKKDHEQHPVGRIGLPSDVAQLALFLSSEQAAFITGQNYVIDGGMTSKMIYI